MALAASLMALAAGLLPAPAEAACGNIPPAQPVPFLVWGDLKPSDPAGELLPSNRRSGYSGQQVPNCNNPVWTGVDAANGYLFVSYAYGFQIWDARDTKAGAPVRLAQRDGSHNNCGNSGQPFGCATGSGCFWPPPTEDKIRMLDVAVPAGKDTVAVTVGTAQTGVFVWDTMNKAGPFIRYQDKEKQAFAVHAATTGGRDWAFVGTQGAGLRLYDLTAAMASSTCVENADVNTSCGVYGGRIGTLNQAFRLDGAAVPGVGHVLVVPDTLIPRGLELWDVTNPTSAQLIRRVEGGSSIHDVAIWHQAGSTFVAIRRNTAASIFDITSCLASYGEGGSCDFPASPIWTASMPNTGTPSNSITFSRAGNTPFLFFGTGRETATGQGDRVQLLEVTNPSQPVEISLNGTASGECGTYDYWSWYDQYEKVAPLMARFMGDHLYRAGRTILDVHLLTGLSSGPPQAEFLFTPASDIYPDVPELDGTVVTLQDVSLGDVGSREWVLPSQAQCVTGCGTNPPSAAQIQIRFEAGSGPSPGAGYPVTLKVRDSNGFNPDERTKPIPVLSPSPAVGSVSRNVSSAQVCTPVTFTAQNLTGYPAPTLSWEVIQQGGGPPEATGGDVNPFTWNTAGAVAGNYFARVEAQNSSDTATKDSLLVEIQALEPLGFTGDATPIPVGAPSGGTVTVSIEGKTTGATEWSWDFGEGAGWGPWSTDPVTGPEPTHTYGATGSFQVRLQIRNCEDTTPKESEPLAVTITELTPLAAAFLVNGSPCPFGCTVDVGQAFNVTDLSSGDPAQWVYKWNNTNSGATIFGQCAGAEEIRTSPKPSHTYTTTGQVYPCLEVRKGGNSDLFVHPGLTVRSGAPPPPPASITVSGPSSATEGEQRTYSATASNCSASPSGWSWSLTGGGTIHGGQGSSSVTVSWSTAGSKQVRASNSACGTAVGTRSVIVEESESQGNCVAGDTTLCLHGGRFQVEVGWEDFNGSSGDGMAVPATSETGYFWFFNPDNLELAVKVLDAEQINGYFWVFYGSLSNVAFELTVTDTVTGNSKTYLNLLGKFASKGDIEALPGDPDAPPPPGPGPGALQAAFQAGGGVCSGIGCFAQVGQEITFLDESQGDPELWVYDWTNTLNSVVACDFSGAGHTEPVTSHTFEEPGDYFPCLQVEKDGATHAVVHPKITVSEASEGSATVAPALGGVAPKASCDPGQLCLHDGRFQVEVEWTNFNGGSGPGTPVPLTSETGSFWFFSSENTELLIKILDARHINGYFWIFFGSLSNVEYTITVTDTVSGAQKQYHNPLDNFGSRGDDQALPGD